MVDERPRIVRQRANAIPVEEVADLVVKCVEIGEPYIDVIARKYGIVRATAARWVHTARQRGLLPPGNPAVRTCRLCGGSGQLEWGSSRKAAS